MANQQIIQVFEHETLRVGRDFGKEVVFSDDHLKALARYNEQHGNKYFTLVHNGVKFRQYVGVIQCGRLVIEVLPKADRKPASALTPEDRNKWHNVLTDMLAACRWLRLDSVEAAHLRLSQASLLAIYVARFLDEVNRILRQGLVKKYRPETVNRTALKGRLEFSRHISDNVVHQERFYTTAQVYDSQHLLHQILYKALRLLPQLTLHPELLDTVQRTLLLFPEMPDMQVNQGTFEGLIFNRKTEHYRESVALAKLLLLNLQPALQPGSFQVMAILFDMNALFEEYLFHQLRRAGYTVRFQRGTTFWETHRIRYDIFVELPGGDVVLDAKWKIVLDNRPADADLKQMYAYHHYFDTKRTFLVYPKVDSGQQDRIGKFKNGEGFECGLLFINLLGLNGKLSKNVAQDLVDILQKNEHKQRPHMD